MVSIVDKESMDIKGWCPLLKNIRARGGMIIVSFIMSDERSNVN